MTLNDPIAAAISKINNAVKAVNKKVILRKSKLLVNLLEVLKAHGYSGSYEGLNDVRHGLIKVNLL